MTKKTTTIEPCLGIPVRFDPKARAICDSRGIWRWKKIVVGPDFQHFPPAEQYAMLLHEAAHCKMFHVEKRLLALLAPWRIPALCKEQEFAADRFVRALGMGHALAAAFARLSGPPGPLHPPRQERINRLI